MRGAAALKVGSLVVVLAAAGFGVWKAFFDQGAGTFRVWGHFRNAVGLVDKSRVQIAGIVVGEIESRTMDSVPAPDAGMGERRIPMARVTIRISKKVVLYSNATLGKASASTLGASYIDIDPGTPFDRSGTPNHRLKDGDEVTQIKEPTTLAEAMERAQKMLPELQQTMREIKGMTSGQVKQALRDIDTKINESHKTIKAMFERAGAVASDVRGTIESERENVLESIRKLRDVTRGINQAVEEGGRVETAADDFNDELEKIKQATDKFDKQLASLDADVSGLARGEGQFGKLLKDPAIAESVTEVTKELADSFAGFNRIQTLVGLRSEYYWFTSGLKSYFSLRIQPKPDKYYLVELVSDPRGFRHESITFSESSDPRRPHSVSTKKVEITDQFRFTVQWAKRVDWWTGRFGIKESTGGFGSDFHFWGDRAELQVDLFDFRANIFPRLKVAAAFQFFRYVYVLGGYDDLLNARNVSDAGGGSGRDYFLGAMLRFNDQDLRYLLIIAGGALPGGIEQ